MQTGRCGNLSALLQSACRKIRRREDGPAMQTPPKNVRDMFVRPVTDVHPQTAQPAMAKEGAEQRVERGEKALGSSKQPPVAPSSGTAWSASRFDRVCRQPGAFEFKQSSRVDPSEGPTWDLRIKMSELDPPLNDDGMQIYCRWLREALQKAREEHGIRSLRQIRAEISFARNGMGDDAVDRLLQSLQRLELRVASLNLSGNLLGTLGVGHVCEFIRGASFAVLEVNLSQNLLDDAAVLELVRLFAECPRYPARMSRSESVRLNLSSNCVKNVSRIFRKIEGMPGLSVLVSKGRHAEWHV
ncbi:unnamed protein product, partial [Polarella glacialis]